MAESKGALIAKTVQKHAGRAKEKVSISIDPLSSLFLSLSLSFNTVLAFVRERYRIESRFSFAMCLNMTKRRPSKERTIDHRLEESLITSAATRNVERCVATLVNVQTSVGETSVIVPLVISVHLDSPITVSTLIIRITARAVVHLLRASRCKMMAMKNEYTTIDRNLLLRCVRKRIGVYLRVNIARNVARNVDRFLVNINEKAQWEKRKGEREETAKRITTTTTVTDDPLNECRCDERAEGSLDEKAEQEYIFTFLFSFFSKNDDGGSAAASRELM